MMVGVSMWKVFELKDLKSFLLTSIMAQLSMYKKERLTNFFGNKKSYVYLLEEVQLEVNQADTIIKLVQDKYPAFKGFKSTLNDDATFRDLPIRFVLDPNYRVMPITRALLVDAATAKLHIFGLDGGNYNEFVLPANNFFRYFQEHQIPELLFGDFLPLADSVEADKYYDINESDRPYFVSIDFIIKKAADLNNATVKAYYSDFKKMIKEMSQVYRMVETSQVYHMMESSVTYKKKGNIN